mmetsp:Transcript_1728/g.4252  ORF Transcript_1728/g.4252 Transcript_1728/m.4252 type:complete len:539 (-) Transcript_1728:31-1647(-)
MSEPGGTAGLAPDDLAESEYELLGEVSERNGSLNHTLSRIYNYFAEDHKRTLCKGAAVLGKCQSVKPSRGSADGATSQAGGGAVRFSVAQYNLLADYLGSNTEPWFLYGVQGLDGARAHLRAEMLRRLYSKDAAGQYVYTTKWPYIAQGLLTEQEITAVDAIDRQHFLWERRRERIMQEVRAMSADIVSLVELDHYDDWAEPLMAAEGYDSRFHKRPRPTSRDGCGLFWRRSKFDLVKVDHMDFVDSFKDNCGKREPHRDRCALLALLKLKGAEHSADWYSGHILVVSTHLARNPESEVQDKLRANQVRQLLVRLTRFEQLHPGEMRDTPIVLAGDMNATNFEHLWATAGALALDFAGNREKHTYARFANNRTYQMLIGWSDVPTGLTSITTERTVRIDALMYKPKQLEVVRVMPQPVVVGPIPDERHPSDHLPICATFRVRKPNEFGIRRRSSLSDSLGSRAMRDGGLANAYNKTRPAGAADGDMQAVTTSIDVVHAPVGGSGSQRRLSVALDEGLPLPPQEPDDQDMVGRAQSALF